MLSTGNNLVRFAMYVCISACVSVVVHHCVVFMSLPVLQLQRSLIQTLSSLRANVWSYTFKSELS